MASFKNAKVLTSFVASSLALSLGLAACGKPEIRSKTMDSPSAPATTAPSTSSNPKVAEAENKAGDAALKDAAKTDPKAALAAEAAAARKQAALDELAELMKREGTDAQTLADAKAKVTEAGGTLPPEANAATPAIPKTAADEDAAKTALIEHAAHLTFAIAMVEPVMRADFQIFMSRYEVLRLKTIVEVEKKELTAEQTTWLKKLRLDYGLAEDNKDFAALLERVDGVNLSFLAAPMALRSNWAIDGDVQADKIIKRVQELNISPSDEKVRFRSARLAVKAQAQEESISIMKAFLGYNDGTKTPAMENILAAVAEISKLTGEPGFGTEVERVRVLLLEEYKNNQTTKTVPVDAAKK